MAANTIDMMRLREAQWLGDLDPVLSLLGACPYEWRRVAGDDIFTFEDVNLAATILHCRPDDVPTSVNALRARFGDDAIAVRRRAFSSLSWDGARIQIDYQIRAFDGRNVWVEERAVRLKGDRAQPTHIIGVISDIQGRKLAENQAGYHAAYDSRTGLWNKTRLNEGLSQMMAFSKRYGHQASFLALSIANLNDINLNYGYEAGDRLLRAIGARLTASVRAPDICGRLSGPGFGVGLTNCSAEDMQGVAERIVAILSNDPYSSPYGDLHADFAVGGYAISADSHSAADAIECSATALAHSRSRGGEFVAYAHDLPDLRPRRKMAALTRDDIVNALNDRQISIAYQPIIHAQSREIHHYECLLRLRRDDGELVSAAEFIVAAERLGCVDLLDRRALEIASKTLRDDPDIHLALNVSAATVKSQDMADEYLATVRTLGADAERVILELTETVALEDPAMASKFSDEARSMGCRFAIDDFGAGYTTFSNLMAIEADEIKIDGSFIRELSFTPHKQVFVRMMVDLAQTFGVKTVAEMVGSREDAEILTRLGVDYLQGFMFGLPAPTPARRDRA